MIHFLSFVILLFVAFLFPWWVFACMALVYVFVFTAYELLCIAVCVDALFGNVDAGVWFMYTLTVSVLLVASSCMKPYLRVYR